MTEISKAYFSGLRDGVERFAWWKDGVQYVGTTGTTLKQALAEIDEEQDLGQGDCLYD